MVNPTWRGDPVTPPRPTTTISADEQAIRDWLCAQLGDRATADLLWDFATTHRDIVCWKLEAEHAHAMPHTEFGASVSGTPDTERATAARAIHPSQDARDLERLRKRAEARLRRTVHWYYAEIGEYGKNHGLAVTDGDRRRPAHYVEAG